MGMRNVLCDDWLCAIEFVVYKIREEFAVKTIIVQFATKESHVVANSGKSIVF